MTNCHFLLQFARWLTPSDAVAMARRSLWQIRQGKIEPFEFLVGLVFGQLSSLGLTLTAHAGCFTEPVTRQAVDQRYNEHTVDFFRAAFRHCLGQNLDQPAQPGLTQDLARRFAAIHLVDSSSFDCPECLAEIFPGCGGDASAANCKMLLSYEYLHGHFVPLGLLPGKRSDPGLADLLPSIPHPNELIMTDKGFFKLAALSQIDRDGAWFLMPLPRSVGVRVRRADGTLEPLDVASQLRASDQPLVQWPSVYLGAGTQMLAVRVAAFRLSPQSAERHRAALRESHRKQGRTPSAASLELAGWLILMTNAPEDKLPTHAMSYLYRLRWQIELVFKQCKSVLRLDQTQARHNPYRV